LRASVESYIEDASSTRVEGSIVGLIVPHGAQVEIGPVAGHAYKLLLTTPLVWDAVTMLASSTTAPAGSLACDPAEAYDMPTGPAQIDHDRARTLRDVGVAITLAPDDEPLVESHLPFLQAALGDVSVLPLRVGTGVEPASLDGGAGRLGLIVAISNLPAAHERAGCDAITRLDAAFFSGRRPAIRTTGLAGLLGTRPAVPAASPDTAVLALALSAAHAQGARSGILIRRDGRLAACALLRR
jgi:hypothetical protein